MEGRTVLQASHLSHYYGSKAALKDVSFQIGQGQVVGLLGLNGAGKTTCLRAVTGALIPFAGNILIDGLDTALHPKAVRRKIGYLPEVPPLYPELSIRDYLRFVSGIRTGNSSLFQKEFERVCEVTGLTGFSDSPIQSLSLGFRKRTGIAQAIIGSPELVILDEPVSGLDPRQIVEIRNLIRSLGEDHTVLLSSHILGEIEKTCDRVLVLHEGSLVADISGARLSNLETEFMSLTSEEAV